MIAPAPVHSPADPSSTRASSASQGAPARRVRVEAPVTAAAAPPVLMLPVNSSTVAAELDQRPILAARPGHTGWQEA